MGGVRQTGVDYVLGLAIIAIKDGVMTLSEKQPLIMSSVISLPPLF